MDILRVSKFVSFHGHALIIRKMVERNVFFVNSKLQDHVSQYGEHYRSANNKKDGDYYEHLSLSNFTGELKQ